MPLLTSDSESDEEVRATAVSRPQTSRGPTDQNSPDLQEAGHVIVTALPFFDRYSETCLLLPPTGISSDVKEKTARQLGIHGYSPLSVEAVSDLGRAILSLMNCPVPLVGYALLEICRNSQTIIRRAIAPDARVKDLLDAFRGLNLNPLEVTATTSGRILRFNISN
jgi:hypothetical protein